MLGSPTAKDVQQPLLQRGQRAADSDKVSRYVEALANLSEQRAPQFAHALRALKPVFGVLWFIFFWVVKAYWFIYTEVYALYCLLPQDELQVVIGILLCFFGGTYVTLIAAIEAFRTMGGSALWDQLQYVFSQAKLVYEAAIQDDTVDANRDGIPDVEQISTQEFTERKLKLAMVSITDPGQLESAVGSLWAACLAVLATLKLQFAQTTAYALAIAEMVEFPVVRLVAPLLTWALGAELVHWVDTIIDCSLKLVCILLVWSLEKIRAAFYAGLRGGKLFAEALLRIAQRRGLLDAVPESIIAKPFDPETSYVDEALGFPLAAIGFWFQVSNYFFLPFPLDVLLWPVSCLETFLELQVSWSW